MINVQALTNLAEDEHNNTPNPRRSIAQC